MSEEVEIVLKTRVEGAEDVESYRKSMEKVEQQADKTAKTAEKASGRMSEAMEGFGELNKELGQVSPVINKLNSSLTKLTSTWKRFHQLRSRRMPPGTGTVGGGIAGGVENTGLGTGGTARAGRIGRGLKGLAIGVAGAAAIGSIFNALTGSGAKLAAFDRLNALGEPGPLDAIADRLPKIIEELPKNTVAIVGLTAAINGLKDRTDLNVPTPDPIIIPVDAVDENGSIDKILDKLPKSYVIPITFDEEEWTPDLPKNLTIKVNYEGEDFDIPIPEEFVTVVDFEAKDFKIDLPTEWIVNVILKLKKDEDPFKEPEDRAWEIKDIIGTWFIGIPPAALTVLFSKLVADTVTIKKNIKDWFDDTIRVGAQAFGDALAEDMKIVEKIANAVRSIPTVLIALFNRIATEVGKIGEGIGNWFNGVATAAGEIFDGILTWVGDAATGIGKWFDDAKKTAEDMFNGILTWVGDAAAGIGAWFSGVADEAGKIFNSIATEVGNIAMGIGAWFNGVRDSANEIFNSIATAVGNIGKTIGSWFNGVADEAGKVFKGAQEAASKIWNTVANWFLGTAANAGKVFDEALKEAGKVGEVVGKWFTENIVNTANSLFDAASVTVGNIGTAIGKWFDGVTEKADTVFTEASKTVGAIGSAIGKWFTNTKATADTIFTQAWKNAVSIANTVGNWFNGVKGSADRVFDEAIKEAEKIGQTIGSWFDGVVDQASALFSYCASVADSIGSGISNWFNNSVLNSAKSFWNSIASWVNSIGSEIASWGDMAHRGIQLESTRIRNEYEAAISEAERKARAEYERRLRELENQYGTDLDPQDIHAINHSNGKAFENPATGSTAQVTRSLVAFKSVLDSIPSSNLNEAMGYISSVAQTTAEFQELQSYWENKLPSMDEMKESVISSNSSQIGKLITDWKSRGLTDEQYNELEAYAINYAKSRAAESSTMTPEVKAVLDAVANTFIPGFSQMEKLANGGQLNEGDYSELALDAVLAFIPGAAVAKAASGAAKATAAAGKAAESVAKAASKVDDVTNTVTKIVTETEKGATAVASAGGGAGTVAKVTTTTATATASATARANKKQIQQFLVGLKNKAYTKTDQWIEGLMSGDPDTIMSTAASIGIPGLFEYIMQNPQELRSYFGRANGEVFQPNKPVWRIFGDNQREVEVASPYSTIVQAVGDAMKSILPTMNAGPSASDSRPIEVTVNLDGRTMARAMYDPLESERRRRHGSVTA